ncbi:hypothetical protein SNEBB_008901 [Seison nebaliae]|nr:hypothetical protein SNEBB_008901 [Seison nebaliae]
MKSNVKERNNNYLEPLTYKRDNQFLSMQSKHNKLYDSMELFTKPKSVLKNHYVTSSHRTKQYTKSEVLEYYDRYYGNDEFIMNKNRNRIVMNYNYDIINSNNVNEEPRQNIINLHFKLSNKLLSEPSNKTFNQSTKSEESNLTEISSLNTCRTCGSVCRCCRIYMKKLRQYSKQLHESFHSSNVNED